MRIVRRGLVIERPVAAEAAGSDDMIASHKMVDQILIGTLERRGDAPFIKYNGNPELVVRSLVRYRTGVVDESHSPG